MAYQLKSQEDVFDPPATDEEVEAAFNEWMRRVIDDPEDFAQQLASVQQYLAELNVDEVTPTYGATCRAYLVELIREARVAHETTIQPVGDAPSTPASEPGADLPDEETTDGD